MQTSELEVPTKINKNVKDEIISTRTDPLKFLDYFTSSQILHKKPKPSIVTKLIETYINKELKGQFRPKSIIKTQLKQIVFNEEIFMECTNIVDNGFNLLIYGIGSKFELMKRLSDNYLPEIGDVIFINSGSGTVSIRHIFGTIIDFICGELKSKSNSIPYTLTNQTTWIKDHLEYLKTLKPQIKIILVINCFDAILGIDTVSINMLNRLLGLDEIQLVVSIENTRCFILWDAPNLDFVNLHLDTFLPYSSCEHFFVNQYLRKNCVQECSLFFIFKSLTLNQK